MIEPEKPTKEKQEKPSQEIVSAMMAKYHASPNRFDAKFLFRTVMRNVGFNLGFYIDRQQFNDMMNEYSNTGNLVKASSCDTTAHPNVRTKYFTYRPNGHTYRLLTIPSSGSAYFENILANDFKMVDNSNKAKKDKKKEELLTAIVFSSSQVIFSSRYKEDSKRIYAHFIDAIKKHRADIAEGPNSSASHLIDFDLNEFMIAQ